MATTPNRVTSLVLDTPTWNAAQAHIGIHRTADQINIQASQRQGRTSSNVQYLADQAWALENRFQRWEEAAFSSATFITQADGTTVPNGAWYFLDRTPEDLPGISAINSGTFFNQTIPVFGKLVSAGDSFSQTLSADEASWPRVTEPSETIRLNRIFAGNKTYPANQGYQFMFQVPSGVQAQDWLYTFYFGGPSDADFIPDEESAGAGQFAVSFRGDGTAWLWSVGKYGNVSQFVKRYEFRYSRTTRVADGWHWCQILPYRNNRIIFRNLQADNAPSGGQGLGETWSGRKEPLHTSIYKHSIQSTGHRFHTNICGAGEIRIDARSDTRWRFSVMTEGWKTLGTLYDSPLALPRVIPANTVISIVGDFEAPTGTALTIDVYRNDTSAALVPVSGSTSQFYSVADVREYFVRFTFTGTGSSSPFLRSYTLQVDPNILLSTPTTQTGGLIQAFTATSGSVDPSTETASIQIEDPGNVLTKLGQRARIPCQVRTTISSTYSVLFEGEISRAGQGRKTAPTGLSIPTIGTAATWRVYDALCVGPWARLYDKVAMKSFPYSQDFNAPPGSYNGNQYPPWRVTDIITDLFRAAGVPAQVLDIPTNELRLFPSQNGENGANPLLLPNMNSRYAPVIWDLAFKYLNGFLVWDPNAGTHGMWRLIYAPQNPYIGSFVWDFVFGPAGDAPGPIHHPGRYGAEQTFIYRDTYQQWETAPECNHVVVWGTGGQDANGVWRHSNELRNYTSYDPDPLNPTSDITSQDYLGYELSALHTEPMLRSAEAVEFYCRRIYDSAAHGRKYASWQSPLVLLTNPDDTHQTRPRPLRLGDVVRVNSQMAMIRSSAVEIRRDRGGDAFQLGHYQATFLS